MCGNKKKKKNKINVFGFLSSRKILVINLAELNVILEMTFS